jgi:hypothetical protein
MMLANMKALDLDSLAPAPAIVASGLVRNFDN